MIEITDDDIEKVEQKFDNIKFDDGSKAFIKCMESKDIQACPGAGKTTSLVAKLDILANHMPFDDNSGILVLTHTNVAVNEIKKKLGANAKIVLGYPNHVGTFQSFVNKFLAVPMYIKLIGKKPERIDNEIFENLFYNNLSHNEKFGLKEKLAKFATTDIEKEKTVKSFLKSFYIDENNNLQKFNGKEFDYKHNPPSDTYKKLRNIKKILFEAGFLIFDDSYYLSLKYLTDYPNISNIFQKRFKYVFIDEAQDTNDKQFKIIEKLFENSEVVIQKIGDNNQAIFNFSGEETTGWNIQEANNIEIKNTKRLSKPISEQASKVALVPQELSGSESISIQPTIIIFDDENIELVIQKYAELIVEHDLHLKKSNIFKAIGGVGKIHEEKHTISSYYSSYLKTDNNSLFFDNLIDKLAEFDKCTIQPKDYRNIIFDIVKEYLKKEDVKYKDNFFTKQSILKYLKEESEVSYNNFKLQVFQITKLLYLDSCAKNDLQNLIKIILDLYSKTIDIDVLDMTIRNYKMNFERISKNNIYTYSDGNINFNLEIKTIHKAKGETHTATLVFDTYKDGYDIFQLLDSFKGIKQKASKTIQAKKKLIYVATSRATHLLCLAIHKKHIYRKNDKEVSSEDINLLKNNGFRIIELLGENQNAN